MTTRSLAQVAAGIGAASSEVDFPAAPVAVVGRRPQARRVAETVEGSGGVAIQLADVAHLAGLDGKAAVVVFVGPSLPEVARLLKSLGNPEICPPAIAVCEEVRPGEIRIGLAGGLAGVVMAQEMERSLPACVEAVLAGQVCVPRSQSRQVDAAALSTREKQILGLVVMGCMNSEIADQLVVAESTVKSHLSSAFAKLGVRSRHQAVDLILDSERGLGMGILSIGGEPVGDSGAGSR
jgi:DNA-binding NarL/FixJ family response regulator